MGTIFLQGLILIIPIIGQIALLGWVLLCMDNIRAGQYQLPPAGFHLGRGIQLFGVQLIYGLVIAIPAIILFAIGGALAQQSAGAGALFGVLGYLYELVAGLFFLFLLPAILSATWRGGFSGGMNVGNVWGLATANTTNSILAALIVLVAGIIGEVGIIACFVGVLFTTVYAYAIIAGAASWFDQTTYGQPAPQPGPSY